MSEKKRKEQKDINNFEKEAKNKMEKFNLDIELFKYYIKHISLSILYLVCYISFLLLCISVIVFVVVSLICYCCGSDKCAIVITVMQALTGVLSLVVGFWGLSLTYKSLPTQKKQLTRLNPVTSTVTSADAKTEESDLDWDSLN